MSTFWAAEQNSISYNMHSFANQAHFVAWMKQHRPKNFVKPSNVRGRKRMTIHHTATDGDLMEQANADAYEHLQPVYP